MREGNRLLIEEPERVIIKKVGRRSSATMTLIASDGRRKTCTSSDVAAETVTVFERAACLRPLTKRVHAGVELSQQMAAPVLGIESAIG